VGAWGEDAGSIRDEFVRTILRGDEMGNGQGKRGGRFAYLACCTHTLVVVKYFFDG